MKDAEKIELLNGTIASLSLTNSHGKEISEIIKIILRILERDQKK